MARRLISTFKRLRWEKETALAACVTVGYPSSEITRMVVPVIARQGADLILLRGPEQGISLAECLDVGAEARLANEVPLVLLCSYEALHAYDPEGLVADCAHSGIDGLLVPGLPSDELALMGELCEAAGVGLGLEVAGSVPDEELERALAAAPTFIYCPIGGVDEIEELAGLAARIRERGKVPLLAGRDAGTVEMVARLAGHADGVLAGPSLDALIASLPEDELLLGLSELVRDLKAATRPETP